MCLHHASVSVDAACEDDERHEPLVVALRDQLGRRRQSGPEDDVRCGSCWRGVNVQVGSDPFGLSRAGEFFGAGGHGMYVTMERGGRWTGLASDARLSRSVLGNLAPAASLRNYE